MYVEPFTGEERKRAGDILKRDAGPRFVNAVAPRLHGSDGSTDCDASPRHKHPNIASTLRKGDSDPPVLDYCGLF
jgi:hypothetical protein